MYCQKTYLSFKRVTIYLSLTVSSFKAYDYISQQESTCFVVHVKITVLAKRKAQHVC